MCFRTVSQRYIAVESLADTPHGQLPKCLPAVCKRVGENSTFCPGCSTSLLGPRITVHANSCLQGHYLLSTTVIDRFSPSRRAAACARRLYQSHSRPASRCPLDDSFHGPIVSPSVGQSGSERLAGVRCPSPHASMPGSARHPAAGLLPAGCTASRLAAGALARWGGVRWYTRPKWCIPDDAMAKYRLNFLLCCRCCQAPFCIFFLLHSLRAASPRPEPSGGFG